MAIKARHGHTSTLFTYSCLILLSQKQYQDSSYFDADVLKKSLGKALVPFYPMAGRLTLNEYNGRYEIDCNAKRALFIEAESADTLTNDLGKNDDEKKLYYPSCDYSKGLSTFPLVMVQLTRFKCGGVCLGFSQHHHVADGSSHVQFNKSWGRLAQGLEITVLPVHDRFSYVGPREPPQVKFLGLHYLEPPLPPIDFLSKITSIVIEGTFKLSKNQIEALRQDVMSYQEISSYNVSTFTLLPGHVWRTACKARNLKNDQDVKLYIPVDGRQFLKLPIGYCGNAIVLAACKAKAGDLTNKPLWYTVSKVCEMITNMKNAESFRSAIDYEETQTSLDPLVRNEKFYTCPNLGINSWMNLRYKEADFGWGGPKFVRHGGVKYEGQSALVRDESEVDSTLLNIKLFSAHMVLFEKYFYDLSL